MEPPAPAPLLPLGQTATAETYPEMTALVARVMAFQEGDPQNTLADFNGAVIDLRGRWHQRRAFDGMASTGQLACIAQRLCPRRLVLPAEAARRARRRRAWHRGARV